VSEIHKNIKTIRESQIRMETDLKHHIKRTDDLEEIVLPVHRTFTFFKMVTIAASVFATFFAVYKGVLL